MKKSIINKLLFILGAFAFCFSLGACDFISGSDSSSKNHEHSYSEWTIVKEATCLTTGIKTRTCSCGDVQSENIDILDHTLSDWIIDKEATCSDEGCKHKECSFCLEVIESEVIAKKEHTIEIDEEVAADCTHTGLTEGMHCSICQEIIVKQEVIPIIEHIISDWIIDKEATCIEEGSKHKECSICHEVIENEVIAKKEHTIEIDEEVAADCTHTGLTEGKHCSICQEIIVKQEVIPIIEHTLTDWIIDKEATCSEEGSKHKECSICHEVIESEVIAKKEHTIEIDEEVAADCTHTGLTEGKHCSICQEVLVKQEVIPIIEHNISDWIIDKEATCSEEGSKHKECSICHEVFEIENIPMIEHTPSEWKTEIEATCLTTGKQYIQCLVCQKILEQKETNKTDHKYLDTVIPPTKIDDGYTLHTCVFCGDQIKDNYVDAIDSIGLEYTLNSDEQSYSVSGIGSCTDKDIVIPKKYNSLDVTSIGDYAFYDCNSLTSIKIGNSVTSIGDYAFYDCYKLVNVTIGKSVTSIGDYAFYDCNSLTSIEIPASVTSIGECSFGRCLSLVSIEIPDSVTAIGDDAFSCCYKLVEVINHSSLQILKGSSDYGDLGYYALNIKTSGESDIKNINDYLFYTYEEVNYLLGYIGNDVVLVLPDNYNEEEYEIYNLAFASNSYLLTSIEIPNSVTAIGDDAFPECYKLAEVINHSSLSISKGSDDYGYIGMYALNIKTSGKSDIKNIDDYLFYTYEGINYLLGYIGNDTELVLPNSYNGEKYQICYFAFYDCTSLTSIEIPDGVTIIGSGAFFDCSSLTSVTIGDGVTIIGSSAFEYCSSLTSIEIPDSVTSIGNFAFSDCSSLTSIEIPDSVTSIGEYAFSSCDSLTSIEIPDGVTIMAYRAFYDCDSLTSIKIGNSVTSIGDDAFYDCNTLTRVKIGNSLTSIGEYAFYNCSSLTSIEIPDSVTSIGDDAFCGCCSITSIEMPDSVTSIGDYAFSGCCSLTSIEISDRVTSIGYNAFFGCYKLAEVINHSSLSISKGSSNFGYIGYYALNIKTSVESEIKNIDDYLFYTYDGVNYLLGYIGNDTELVLPNSYNGKDYQIYKHAFYKCSSLTSIEIPDSVTSIGEYAFSECYKLVEVINHSSLPISKRSSDYGCVGGYALNIKTSGKSDIKNIDDYLFYTYEGINYLLGYIGNDTELVLPDSYDGKDYQIYNYAFYKCSSLTSIEIPDSVTRIGDYAFYKCSSLTRIEIPDSLTSIGYNALYGCNSLKFKKYKNGYYLGNLSNEYLVLYSVIDYSCEKFEISSKTKIIYSNAFESCSSLESIEIPDSVTYIGSRAFCGNFYNACRSLKSVRIGNSVTSIGEYAFSNCSSLISIEIPDSVTYIGNHAFSDCGSLFSVSIGNSVSYIGDLAFYDCYKIAEVINHSSLQISKYFRDYRYAGMYALNIKTSGESEIKNIDDYLFYTYDGINYLLGYIGNDTELVLPDSYNGEKYQIYKYAFYSCDSLTSIEIPDSVTSIGEYAFSSCDSLTSIEIPDSVTSIGERAFYDCYSLTIYCENESKPIGWSSNWADCTVIWGAN